MKTKSGNRTRFSQLAEAFSLVNAARAEDDEDKKKDEEASAAAAEADEDEEKEAKSKKAEGDEDEKKDDDKEAASAESEDDEKKKDDDKDASAAESDDEEKKDAKSARISERKRIEAIMLSGVGKRNPLAASHAAFGTNMSAGEAIGNMAVLEAFFLKKNDSDAPAARADALHQRMAEAPKPSIGNGVGSEPLSGSDAAAAFIIQCNNQRLGLAKK